MAKLDLNPGETMIGSGQMSLYQKQGLMKSPSKPTYEWYQNGAHF